MLIRILQLITSLNIGMLGIKLRALQTCFSGIILCKASTLEMHTNFQRSNMRKIFNYHCDLCLHHQILQIKRVNNYGSAPLL